MRTNPPGPKTLIAIAIFFILFGTFNLLITDKQVIEMGAHQRIPLVPCVGLIIIGGIILVIRIGRYNRRT